MQLLTYISRSPTKLSASELQGLNHFVFQTHSNCALHLLEKGRESKNRKKKAVRIERSMISTFVYITLNLTPIQIFLSDIYIF